MVSSEAGFVDLLAKSPTPRVWEVAKAHPKTRRDLPTVLFAMRIIEHVYKGAAELER
ncbi:MAG: hypothetical protein ACREOW_13030 [Thermodesulfobacteriota bacterium]